MLAAARSPADVAARTDAVITMLPDTPNLLAVVSGQMGLGGVLSANSLLIDMSTVDPAH